MTDPGDINLAHADSYLRDRAAVGQPDELAHEPHRLQVIFVPAFEEDWTDVEISRDERICIMAHVLTPHAAAFVEASIVALGGVCS